MCDFRVISFFRSATGLSLRIVLELPAMVNTRALSNEEELVLHRPRMERGKKTVPVKLSKIMTPKVQQTKKSVPA